MRKPLEHMVSESQSLPLEAASGIRTLIATNSYLESEVNELMKAVSHAYARGRFHTNSRWE
jgi:hypothetical protein